MIERPGFQLAAWALAAVVVVFAALRLLGPGSDAEPPPVQLEGASAVPGRQPGRRRIYVHVAGAVRRPGLYRVSAGDRAALAVKRAGGFRPGADAAAVNLAARLRDGEQVVVPRAGAAAHGSAGPAKINLATATPEQLDSLDGIGPTLAERIVEYRDAHGGLRSLDQLRDVDGIGEKRFAALERALGP